MFRRIELIERINLTRRTAWLRDFAVVVGLPTKAVDQITSINWKHGLTGIGGNGEVFDAWGDMRGPRRRIFKNCRFYFTEKGWRRYGRPTVAACLRTGQRFRVIAIKERSVDVVYRDEIQVAVRPKKKHVVQP
jgi:hypothetical protein